MSLRPDGTYRCDRCGADVNNGGVAVSAIVADLHPDQIGTIRMFHFCRGREDVVGCASVVLNDENLANYLEENGTSD